MRAKSFLKKQTIPKKSFRMEVKDKSRVVAPEIILNDLPVHIWIEPDLHSFSDFKYRLETEKRNLCN